MKVIKGWRMPYCCFRRRATKMLGLYVCRMGLTIDLIWWAFEIWTPYRVSWERKLDGQWKELDKRAAELDAQKAPH